MFQIIRKTIMKHRAQLLDILTCKRDLVVGSNGLGGNTAIGCAVHPQRTPTCKQGYLTCLQHVACAGGLVIRFVSDESCSYQRETN